MKFTTHIKLTCSLIALFPLLNAFGAEPIDIDRGMDPTRWPSVQVLISGFSDEVDRVLRSDLLFMGIVTSTPDKAKYLISGSNSGRVEGRVTDKYNKNQLLAKAYTGGSLRAQTHAFADDIAKCLPELQGIPPIAQTKVVFKVETGGGNSEIYLSDYDVANAKPVTADHSLVAAPCWAGRGILYYTSYKKGYPFVFKHELSTGARTPVAAFSGLNSSASVSPNGRKLVMILSKNGSPDVYVCNPDGSGLKQLTFTREDESSPCWSPDSQTICYVSRSSGAARLYAISASGGTPRRIMANGAANPTEPDWSPDGKWIAFTSQTRDFTVCIVKSEGGDAVPLVSGEDPSWAPNSRALMFCKGPDHEKILCLLDVPTRHVKTINRILGSNSYPSWAK